MPSTTQTVAAQSPAFIADTVAETPVLAAGQGLYRAIGEMAKAHGLLTPMLTEWVSRARAIQGVPVPPGLLFCRPCDQPMILVQPPTCEPVYLCRPTCGHLAVPAAPTGELIARAVLQHTPHLVPNGKTADAAAYALGAMQRVTIGATPPDLHIIWRQVPRQLTTPLMSMAQRLDLAHRHAARDERARVIDVLHTGLLQVDPATDGTAVDTATGKAAALLAELTLIEGDPTAALPWAIWAHRCLHRLIGPSAAETRNALKILAATHRRAGNLTDAATCYSDLIRHHSTAKGARAQPTLATQATLALVLHQSGQCLQAQQLLAQTFRMRFPRFAGGSMTKAAFTVAGTASKP